MKFIELHGPVNNPVHVRPDQIVYIVQVEETTVKSRIVMSSGELRVRETFEEIERLINPVTAWGGPR